MAGSLLLEGGSMPLLGPQVQAPTLREAMGPQMLPPTWVWLTLGKFCTFWLPLETSAQQDSPLLPPWP